MAAQLKVNDPVYVTAEYKDGNSHAVAYGRIIAIEGDIITISTAKVDDELLTQTFAPLEQLG